MADDLVSIWNMHNSSGAGVNEVYRAITARGIRLEGGMIPASDVSGLEAALRGDDVVGPVAVVQDEVPVNGFARSSGRKFRTYVDPLERDKFLADMADMGHGMRGFPARSVFNGLVYIIEEDIPCTNFEGQPLVDFVGGMYPSIEVAGVRAKHNTWLISSAQTYLGWDDATISEVNGLRSGTKDEFALAHAMARTDLVNPMGAYLFYKTIILGEKPSAKNPVSSTRSQYCAIDMYRGMGGDLRDRIAEAYRGVEGDPYKFILWVVKNGVRAELEEPLEYKVFDDKAHSGALMFVLSDEVEGFGDVKTGRLIQFERPISAYRKMTEFRGSSSTIADVYSVTVERMKRAIDDSMERFGKVKGNFLTNEVVSDGTYGVFSAAYREEGLQFGSFVNYMYAALLMDSAQNPDSERQADNLILALNKREFETYDRLRGRNEEGKTSMVDMVRRAVRGRVTSYALAEDVQRNWGTLQPKLMGEGCWLVDTKRAPFKSVEIERMYDLVGNYPGLFPQ